MGNEGIKARVAAGEVVGCIARLCENPNEAISEQEKEVRITLTANKNAVQVNCERRFFGRSRHE